MDGFSAWGAIAAAIRILVPRDRAARPKLKLIVASRRVRRRGTVWIFVKVTNTGDAAITLDRLACDVKGQIGQQSASVAFRSGPKIPLRLDSYSSATWETTIKTKSHPWMTTGAVTCSVFVAGGGKDAYQEKEIPDTSY
jgi:hypothetical protein